MYINSHQLSSSIYEQQGLLKHLVINCCLYQLLTLQFLLAAMRVKTTTIQTLVHTDQLKSAFTLNLWATRRIKNISLMWTVVYQLSSTLTLQFFIISKQSQNNIHTNSCLYQLSPAFILDLWATRRVKHCYIVSYKLLSSNSYHHYFIQLRTHLHVYQNKTLFLLLLERKTWREATSKDT